MRATAHHMPPSAKAWACAPSTILRAMRMLVRASAVMATVMMARRASSHTTSNRAIPRSPSPLTGSPDIVTPLQLARRRDRKHRVQALAQLVGHRTRFLDIAHDGGCQKDEQLGTLHRIVRLTRQRAEDG